MRCERSDGTAAEAHARAQAEASTGPCTEACAAAKACAQARNGKKYGIADRAGGAACGSARSERLPVFAEPQNSAQTLRRSEKELENAQKRAENAETRADLAESRVGELEQELADTTAQLEDVSASYENLAASEEAWKEMADANASELEGENAKSEAFDALVDFANGHNPGGSSDIFRISEAVVVMKTSDAPRSVLLTTDFNPNSIVRRELDGDSADVAFTEDKWGSSTPMTVTPKHAGTTVVTFSNTYNKQTFTMLVIVFDD